MGARRAPTTSGSNGRIGVPFTRLDNADPYVLEELMLAVERVAHSGAFTFGEEVEAFEREFAAYCGAGFAIGVGSGTDALVLALRALDVGPDDEVIVPTNSFVATAEAVTLVGARPRLVDVDPVTHLVTAEIVERNLSERTRCVIPVHLYGRTVDLAPILELTRERGVAVLEDACQAHGAVYRDRRVGSIGDAGCFSFYPAKNLGAWGDGGAVVTNDAGLADRVQLLRSHGEKPRNHHRLVGCTSRLDAIQAAVLRVKLRSLDEWNDRRRRIAAALTAALAEAPVLTPAAPADGSDHVFHLYVVVSEARDQLRTGLARLGIQTAIHYPVPIHRSEAYVRQGLDQCSLPVAEGLAERVCSLPLFPTLTDDEVALVADAIGSCQSRGSMAA